MSRINPLYLIALFLGLFLFSIVSLSSAKKELQENQKSYDATYALAHELQALKNVYDKKEQQQKNLTLLLQHAMLKEANLQKKVQKTSWHVSTNEIDQKALDFFLGKIFNESYPIKKYKIEKIDATKAKLDMEIQW